MKRHYLVLGGVLILALISAGLWLMRPRPAAPFAAAPSSPLREPAGQPALPTTRSYHTVDISPEAAEKSRAARQVQTLNEILASRNDNDPRLDTELLQLGPEAKKRLRERYAQMRPEDRNGRGTVVFLLGRNITSPEDLRFFDSVLREPACRSLADCRKPPAQGRDDEHARLGAATTLAYPQLVALKALEDTLNRLPKSPLTAEARAQVVRASKSPVPLVARKARAILAGQARE